MTLTLRLNNLIKETMQGNHGPESLIAEFRELDELFDEAEYDLDRQAAAVAGLLLAWISELMKEDSHIRIDEILSTWYGVQLISPQALAFGFVIFFAYLDDFFTDAPLGMEEIPCLLSSLMAQHFLHISLFQDTSEEFKDFPSARLLVLRSLLKVKENEVIGSSGIDVSDRRFGLDLASFFAKSKDEELANTLLAELEA
jgi:hypothetical protein